VSRARRSAVRTFARLDPILRLKIVSGANHHHRAYLPFNNFPGIKSPVDSDPDL
jgi:hypothetical protein